MIITYPIHSSNMAQQIPQIERIESIFSFPTPRVKKIKTTSNIQIVTALVNMTYRTIKRVALALLAMVFLASSHAESQRTKYNFNPEWKFLQDNPVGAAAWTQPVVAAVPHEAIGRATWARVAVPTHRFSATGGYGLQGRALLATQPVAVASKEAFPMSYKEVGDAGPCVLVSAGVPHAGLLLFVFRTARQSVDGLHVSHALLMANRRHVSVQRSGAYVLVT